MNFGFRSVTTADMPTLHTWMSLPHVSSWFGERPTQRQVDEIYGKQLDSDDVKLVIVTMDATDFGFIECVRSADEHAWMINQFIGEEQNIGKGYGPQFIKQYIEQELFTDEDVNKVIAKVHVSNLRAYKCYQKAGFSKTEVVEDGQYNLLEKTREH